MKFNVTKQEIQQQFHLPLEEAAKALGICASVLKRSCRQHGIKRWPYRKIRSLNKRKSVLESATKTMHDQFKKMKAELDEVNKERRDILSNIGADNFDEEGEDLDIDDLVEEKTAEEEVDNETAAATSSSVPPPPSYPSSPQTVVSSRSSPQQQQPSVVDQQPQQQPISQQLPQNHYLSQPIQHQIQQQPQQQQQFVQQLQQQQQQPVVVQQRQTSPSLPGIGQLFASLHDRKDVLQLMDHSTMFMTDANGNILWTSSAVQQFNIVSNVGSNMLNHRCNTMKTNQVYESILKGQYQYAEIDLIIPTTAPANNNNNSNSQYYQYLSLYAMKCDGLGYSWSVRYRTLSALPLERIIPSSSIAIHPRVQQQMSSYSNQSAAADYTLHSVNAFLIDVK